jgi:hypothetical protein
VREWMGGRAWARSKRNQERGCDNKGFGMERREEPGMSDRATCPERRGSASRYRAKRVHSRTQPAAVASRRIDTNRSSSVPHSNSLVIIMGGAPWPNQALVRKQRKALLIFPPLVCGKATLCSVHNNSSEVVS